MTAGEGGAAATCGCPGHFCSLLASSAEIISPGGAHHGDSQAQEGVLQARTLVLHRYAETEMRGIVPEESAVTFKNRHKELRLTSQSAGWPAACQGPRGHCNTAEGHKASDSKQRGQDSACKDSTFVTWLRVHRVRCFTPRKQDAP